MKRFLIIFILFYAFACTQENNIHIELPLSYGLQVKNQVQSDGEQIGVISDLKLSEGGHTILATAKLNAGVRIPLNSNFEVVPADILGTKMIDISYSNENIYHQHNDTVIGFYKDPIENLIDSMLIHSIDSLESNLIIDSLDVDSLFFLIDSILQEGSPTNRLTK